MSQRINYYKLATDIAEQYRAFAMLTSGKPLLKKLRHLVDIRASQINGCAFCLDMHVKEARIDGERELRIYHLPLWRESSLFTPQERAALEWTEAVTRLGEGGVPDEVFNAVRQHFTDEEMAQLTFQVVAINGWNRLAIAFRNEPGSLDKAYGLDKAGLS